jgi:hypothetical protein
LRFALGCTGRDTAGINSTDDLSDDDGIPNVRGMSFEIYFFFFVILFGHALAAVFGYLTSFFMIFRIGTLESPELVFFFLVHTSNS